MRHQATILSAVLTLFAMTAFAMTMVDVDKLDGSDPAIEEENYTRYVYWASEPSFTYFKGQGWRVPTTVFVPKTPGELVVGDERCWTKPDLDKNFFTVKPCSKHYYQTTGPWIPNLEKDPIGKRAATAVSKAFKNHPDKIKKSEGINFKGGSRILDLALNFGIADPFWAGFVSTVHATNPDMDVELFEKQARKGALNNTYFRFNGSPLDTQANFDLAIFDVCDKYRLACFGTWHAWGHNAEPPRGVDGKKYQDAELPYGDLFPGLLQKSSAARLSLAFTNSNANERQQIYGVQSRGHHNLGLSYASYSIDTKREISVGVRYKRHTELGHGLRDQPLVASFRLTLRPKNFKLDVGRSLRWTLTHPDGSIEEGTSEVDIQNELSLDMSLTSNEKHSILKVVSPKALTGMVATWSPLQESEKDQRERQVFEVAFLHKDAEATSVGLWLQDGTYLDIENCTDGSCSAMEARTSPDGKRIAYVLADVSTDTKGVIRSMTSSKIIIFDFETGKKTELPGQRGFINRQPTWPNNDELIFASTRPNLDGTDCFMLKDQWNQHSERGAGGDTGSIKAYGVFQEHGYGNTARCSRIWRQRLDGTGLKLLTPHENVAIRPTVFPNDCVVGFSSKATHEDMAYNLERNFPGSTANKHYFDVMDCWGGNQKTVMGKHEHVFVNNTKFLSDWELGQLGINMLAHRSPVMLTSGEICVTSYYRGTKLGGGHFLCRPFDFDNFTEGVAASANYPHSHSPSTRRGTGWVDSKMRVLTPAMESQDLKIRRQKSTKKPFGSMSNLTNLPDGRLAGTWHKGYCYTAGQPPADTHPDFRGCQLVTVELLTESITNPHSEKQLKVLIDEPDKNVYDMDYFGPYSELFDKEEPDQMQEYAGDVCYLDVVNARKAEFYSKSPDLSFLTGRRQKCTKLGACALSYDPEFYEKEIHSIMVSYVSQPDSMYPDPAFNLLRNNTGFKEKRVGVIQPLMADGSARVRVECERALQVSGLDVDGYVISHDSKTHSNRKGERRVCLGCHDGHTEERLAEIYAPLDLEQLTSRGTKPVEHLWAKTLASKTAPALQKPRPRVTWQNSVDEVLQRNCASCHEGLTYDAVAWDTHQLDLPWMKTRVQPAPGHGDTLPRHHTSRLVGRFSRESLLLWVCRNQRLDTLSNDSEEGDIDYTPIPEHDNFSKEDCLKIARWIDTGIQEK